MKGLVHAVIATNSSTYPAKAWVFQGDKYARYDFAADKADLGYPRDAANWAAEIAGGLDGAFDGRSPYAGKAYLVVGSQYYRYDYAQDGIDLGPNDLSAWGVDNGFENGVDTVLNGAGAYSDKVYFFKGDRYQRYSWSADTTDQPEKSLSEWNLPGSFATGIDAAVTGLGPYKNKAYFFKGSDYVRYDWVQDAIDFGPVPIARWWRGLGELVLALNAGYPSLCSQYVFDGRTDDDIADILNMMSATAGQWSSGTAAFALQELGNGNLFGIVRAGNVEHLRPFIPAGLQGPIDQIRSQNYSISANGQTFPADDGGWFRGLIVLNNGQLDQSLPGGALRGFVELVMSHELTHFRNRVERKSMNNDANLDPARYVDVPKAASSNHTEWVRASFIDEIACRHVAWHVGQDRNGGSHDIDKGALFVSANGFAAAAVSPAKDYNDNGYMTSLLPKINDFQKQVGVWADDVATLSFNNDAALDAATKQRIRDEIAFVKPGYDLPLVFPNGMA
jgi:hypothetical protein